MEIILQLIQIRAMKVLMEFLLKFQAMFLKTIKVEDTQTFQLGLTLVTLLETILRKSKTEI